MSKKTEAQQQPIFPLSGWLVRRWCLALLLPNCNHATMSARGQEQTCQGWQSRKKEITYSFHLVAPANEPTLKLPCLQTYSGIIKISRSFTPLLIGSLLTYSRQHSTWHTPLACLKEHEWGKSTVTEVRAESWQKLRTQDSKIQTTFKWVLHNWMIRCTPNIRSLFTQTRKK